MDTHQCYEEIDPVRSYSLSILIKVRTLYLSRPDRIHQSGLTFFIMLTEIKKVVGINRKEEWKQVVVNLHLTSRTLQKRER